jgi:hypothetical protein
MTMNDKNCYQVIVRDSKRKVVLNWTASLGSTITIKGEGQNMLIEKKSMFGCQTYSPAMNESVESRSWLTIVFQGLLSH